MCDVVTEKYDSNAYDEGQMLHVYKLAVQLRKICGDTLKFLNLLGDNDDDEKYIKYLKTSINYRIGAHLCEKYVYGSISLDTFCSEMVEEDLRSFLLRIPHIPDDISEKYLLYEETFSATINPALQKDGTSSVSNDVDTVDNMEVDVAASLG